MNEEDKQDYVFYLWTSKTPPIKYLTELLRDLLTEGNFECNSDGIKLRAVDAGRIVLVHTKLEGSKFEDYYCPNPIVMGLNMEDFFKIIKNMENSDTLKLFIHKKNLNVLGIETYCKEENTCDTTYLNLMDLSNNDLNIPPIEFDNVIVMSSNRFQKICRNIHNFSERIEIECVGSELCFRGCNTNVKQECKIKPTENGMKFIQNENPDEIIQGEFDLKHLVLFSKCSNLSNTIQLHIKNDFPLVIKCDVSNIGQIKLCLAPQSEE